ncbi:MAG: ATP-binding cassette domain-containing protein [Planctomycetota bacterium]|nr:ATP-binding cassette domain-containing protein [Planctomycetota bacterium]MDA1106563.1 ATP-binding cassette domain-containing protein [Planctomycetota bacterium]
MTHANDESSVILSADRLSIGYDGEAVMRDLSFDVRRGEVLVICGGSGCGKTTLMRTIATLLPPISGSLKVSGVELVGADKRGLTTIRNSIGVMFQNGALFGGLSVLENVMLPMEAHRHLRKPVRREMARCLLSAVYLQDAANKLPNELSGGMQKRAAIARALALEPPIVVLDEPSAGLDPITSAELDQLIKYICHSTRRSFIVVTHELPSIFEIADRMVFLDATTKTVTAVGKPQELLRSGPERVRQFLSRTPNDPKKEAA